jgi:uncharacterized protein YmfQ (DUF2313 family)
MGMNRDQYIDLLKNLLPKGIAWPRDITSSFHKIFDAIAEEMVRFDQRISTDLPNEADPNTTLELLTDWERIVQIPDEFQLKVAETVGQRRADILRKLTSRGGQSKQFFIDLAAAFGYTVTINETFPFRSGKNRCGYRCYDVDWKHHWRIIAGSVTSQYFRAGSGRCGDRLRAWRNTTLENVIQNAKPAHTVVHFVYGG